MAIRVTQQYVQYVAEPANADKSKLRVSRVFAQVAVKPIPPTVKPASNSLSLTQLVNVLESPVVTQSIGLTQSLTIQLIGEIILPVGQRIFFANDQTSGEQTVTNNFVNMGDIVNTLGLVVQNETNKDLGIKQYLGFTPRQFTSASNSFLFSNTSAPATVASCGNVFFMVGDNGQNADRWFNADNVIGFTVGSVVGSRNLVTNELTLSDVADTTNSERGGDVPQMALKQTVSVRIANAGNEKTFSPTGDDSVTLPTAPVLQTDTLTISYPTTSPTLTVGLKNPQFGDTDTLTLTRIDRTTRSGQPILFTDPKWAKFERLQMTIENICEVDRMSLIELLNTTLGKEVRLTDWYGRDWLGVIIIEGTSFEEVQGGTSLTLLFEGELE